ncbi:MAG: GGDEF domain-containing protein [Myxococcota bacterium]
MANDDRPEQARVDGDTTAVRLFAAPTESNASEAAMICISGRSVGQIFLLTREETTLGRAPECDIFLDDEGVSRHHAKVVRQDDAWVIMDLASTNGTFIDNERIEVATLRDALRVQLGTSTILQFRYQDEAESEFDALVQSFRTHDPLTEILDHKSFRLELDKEVGFAGRHRQPLTLVVFDLDHFQRINQAYGHEAGDAVLRAVARASGETLRKEDTFGRLESEAFGVLLRATHVDHGFIVAERIRRAIESLEVQHHGRRIPVTASVGVAALGAAIIRAPDLVEAAQERLFQAKRRGRNRTESSLFD